MNQSEYVPEEDCKKLRRLARQGLTSRELSEKLNWSRTATNYHAFGHCEHDHSVEPADSGRNIISIEGCADLRERVKEKQSVKAVAQNSKYSKHTINRHTRGRCHHTGVAHEPVIIRNRYGEEIKYQIHRLYYEEHMPTNEVAEWLEKNYGIDVTEESVKNQLFGST
ncbi:MAG: Clr5 domain-containing protein [Halopenitus sp.]